MAHKHILVAQREDVNIFFDARNKGEPVRWAVPKSPQLAERGDKAIFLLPQQGASGGRKIGSFVAVGQIVSKPEFDRNRWTEWGADVSILHSLQSPVALEECQHDPKFLTWGNLHFPAVWSRSFTIERDYLHDFINFIKRKQRSPADESAFDQAIW